DTNREYTLTVKTPIGCSGSDSAYITVFPGDFGDAITSADYCAPGNAQLWATGGVKYQWIPGTGLDDATSATPTTNASTSTTYNVIITDQNGCTDTME